MNKIIISLALLLSITAKAHDLKLQSSNFQTQIIELYTSEGCSSCPPAERWLSTLKHDKGLWNSFIPVAFHVDYWDYIGWKDKLALPNNGYRQQVHKVFKNIPSVYTPGILKAGKEWRAWRFNNNNEIINSPINVGKLTAKIRGHEVSATFTPTKKLDVYKLNIALLGMNISNQIKTGENQGKSLKHDFVLLKHQTFISTTPNWDNDLDSQFFQSEYQNMAIVIWIEAENNPAPVQAVGQFL